MALSNCGHTLWRQEIRTTLIPRTNPTCCWLSHLTRQIPTQNVNHNIKRFFDVVPLDSGSVVSGQSDILSSEFVSRSLVSGNKS